MKKYRLVEERLTKDLNEVKENVKKLDQETKRILGINETTLELIKNCSLEQIIAMNRKYEKKLDDLLEDLAK
jgi:hypothetical protein